MQTLTYQRGRGVRRTCDGCLEQEPGGEARVLLLEHHRADYPAVTLNDCEMIVAAQRRHVQETAARYAKSR